MTWEEASSAQSPILIFQSIAAAVTDRNTSVQLISTDENAAGPQYQIRIWRSFDSPLSHLQELSVRDIWIDASTYLPKRVSYISTTAYGHAPRDQFDVLFEEFAEAGGFVYPSRSTRMLNEVPYDVITLTSASVNTGLSDSEFQVKD